MKPRLSERELKIIREYKNACLENLKRMGRLYKNRPKEELAVAVYMLKQHIEIIPIPVICHELGVSYSYYRQLKEIHIQEWEQLYQEVWLVK